jgi:hypothetical protein
MQVGDLTNLGLILEIKDNPADLTNPYQKVPRKIALLLPYGEGSAAWIWTTHLKVINEQK